MKDKIIFVAGATGTQGSAVAKALIKADFKVRAIVRAESMGKPVTHELKKLGVEIVEGDFDDTNSVRQSMQNVYGVFSVQLTDNYNTDAERRHAQTLIDCAKDAGVQQIVHCSVNQAGNHLSFNGWSDGKWSEKYWTDKDDVQIAVKNASFNYWTVFKPVYFMDNFKPPMSLIQYPQLAQGTLVTAMGEDVKLQLIAASDIAKFVCAAFVEPEKFSGKEIDLGSEELTMTEVIEVINAKSTNSVQVSHVSEAEAIARGSYPAVVSSQLWDNEVGYNADTLALQHYGISMLTFRQWVNSDDYFA